MEIDVIHDNRLMFSLDIIPRIGETLVWKHNERYLVKDVIHYCNFDKHEVAVIVEKL